MQAAGLTDKLGDASVPYTVLAPTDEAFGIIPQEDFDALVANTEALNVVRAHSWRHYKLAQRICFELCHGTEPCLHANVIVTARQLAVSKHVVQILGLHIIPGTFKAADLTDGLEVETLAGMPLTVTLADGKVTFTAPDMGVAAMVTEADAMACGNVLHLSLIHI